MGVAVGSGLVMHRAFARLAMGLILPLAGCGGSGRDTFAQSTAEPMVAQGAFDSRLEGTWRVLGEGTLLSVTPGALKQYQHGSTVCYFDASGSVEDPAALGFMRFRVLNNSGPVRVELFEHEGGQATSTLERLDTLPPQCLQAAQNDARTALQALCELMGQDYPFFQQRGVDWNTRCASLAPQAAAAGSDPQKRQSVLIDGLRGLGDVHVKLYRTAQDGDRELVFSAGKTPTARRLEEAFSRQDEIDDLGAFQLAWRGLLEERVDERLSAPSGPQLGGTMRWGRLPGNVGYINLYRMRGFSDDAAPAAEIRLAGEAIDRALAALGDTRALIVDVSLNGGGLDAVSAEIASRFADQRRPVFTKRWQRMQGRQPQPWFIEPRGKASYRKPVYVLTSDITGSAAETFTLMMRSLPHVTHAGETTAGALSDILDKALPGGFAVTFTNEIIVAPDGSVPEVSGIKPQLPVAMFGPEGDEALLNGHANAVEALRARAAR